MNTLPLCPRLQLQVPIYIDQIMYLEGQGNYTKLFMINGKQMLLSKNIGLFDELLPHSAFIRLNKTYIVSLQSVDDWTYINARTLIIQLPGGNKIEVSRRRVECVKNRLEQTKPIKK